MNFQMIFHSFRNHKLGASATEVSNMSSISKQWQLFRIKPSHFYHFYSLQKGQILKKNHLCDICFFRCIISKQISGPVPLHSSSKIFSI